MKLIPGGTFTMGSDAAYALPNERPAHEVTVSAFYMDETPVTNAQFAEFVRATGYLTVAERPLDWAKLKVQLPPGTPKPPDSDLQPGALVFRSRTGLQDLVDLSQWWEWTLGASWGQPEGPGTSIEGRENQPVVQIAWDDAVAYANWAGKRLPTEAEWELAARGGLQGKRYCWGDEEKPMGQYLANRWTGDFPSRATSEDGFIGRSPVKSYPPNAFGLYDMTGNVWSWCADVYRADTYLRRSKGAASECCNPASPESAWETIPVAGDPSPAPTPGTLRRVIKGGSYLCHPSYCESYRPAARRGTTPDTATTHVGFRCVRDLVSRAKE